ncbi:tRNA 2-thiouridine(34) synthase MnmA [Elusimicrobiota bacterium]
MKNKKIAVAVSGGVDSGTALFLLKKQGYDVVAVFNNYFECSDAEYSSSCCSIASERKAREVAEYLDVPYYNIDLRKEFKEKVIEPFVEYYTRGLTPNPCIWCNSRLRFSLLVDKLNSMGIEYMATGHYAVLKEGRLFRAGDTSKDQSYFLFDVPRERFKNVIFPVADITKKEVYKIAENEKLPVRDSKESQDCCILMEDNLSSYLKTNINMQEGEIIDQKGEVIGGHPGYQNFTIGQRRGFGGLGEKSYVIGIIPEENRIIVGPDESLFKDGTEIKINPDTFFASRGDELHVKLRSTHIPAECSIEDFDFSTNICRIKFKQPQRSPAPGQSAVLYKDDEVVGGGEILKYEV